MFKTVLKTSSSVLLITALMSLFATIAHADTSSQASSSAQPKTTVRRQVICETGAYGQSTCREVVTEIPVHSAQSVNAGVPAAGLIIAGAALAVAGSAVALKKTR